MNFINPKVHFYPDKQIVRVDIPTFSYAFSAQMLDCAGNAEIKNFATTVAKEIEKVLITELHKVINVQKPKHLYGLLYGGGPNKLKELIKEFYDKELETSFGFPDVAFPTTVTNQLIEEPLPKLQSLTEYLNALKFMQEAKPVTTPGQLIAKAIPNVDLKAHCPVCNVVDTIYLIIIHLNDGHKQPREYIADWVDSLPYDLSFKVKEENDD